MEKAKKLLGDVFAAEKSVDDDSLMRANRIKESEQAIMNANKELAAFEEEKVRSEWLIYLWKTAPYLFMLKDYRLQHLP